MWARVGGEGRCRSGRAFRKQWCGAPSRGHATLAAPPTQQDFTWMPGAPPDPWLPAGDPHGARVSLGPTPGPRQRAPEHFREVTVAVPTARHGVQGTITSAGAMRPCWAPRQVPSGGMDHALGQGCTPTRLWAVCLWKRNVPLQRTPELHAPVPAGSHRVLEPLLSSACRPGTRLEAGCTQRPSHSPGVPVLPLTPRDPRVLPGRKGQALLRGLELQGLGGVTPRPRARKHRPQRRSQRLRATRPTQSRPHQQAPSQLGPADH